MVVVIVMAGQACILMHGGPKGVTQASQARSWVAGMALPPPYPPARRARAAPSPPRPGDMMSCLHPA